MKKTITWPFLKSGARVPVSKTGYVKLEISTGTLIVRDRI